MAGHAIGRRRRVLKRAHARAQRRFTEMFDAHVWSDPEARATILYIEAEHLVEQLLDGEAPTPLPVVVASLRWPTDTGWISEPEAVMLAYQRGELG